MLLIGSHALNYRLGKIREPVDIDYIGTFEELVEYQKKHKESIESIVYESDKKVIIKRKDCIVEFEVAYATFCMFGTSFTYILIFGQVA